MRKIFSWAIGLALAVGGRFEAGEILTVVGLASLPDDLKTWRHWLILAASHFALWVPFAIGFAIILWANWERATMLTKDRRSRNFAVTSVLAVYFFMPLSFESEAAPPAAGPGSVTIEGGNYGNACTNGAHCEINKTVIEQAATNPNALYQVNDIIGRVEGETVVTGGTITFPQLRMSGYLDPNLPVVFRKLTLSCPELDKKETVHNSVIFIDVWTNKSCKVIDPKQVKRK